MDRGQLHFHALDGAAEHGKVEFEPVFDGLELVDALLKLGRIERSAQRQAASRGRLARKAGKCLAHHFDAGKQGIRGGVPRLSEAWQDKRIGWVEAHIGSFYAGAS